MEDKKLICPFCGTDKILEPDWCPPYCSRKCHIKHHNSGYRIIDNTLAEMKLTNIPDCARLGLC